MIPDSLFKQKLSEGVFLKAKLIKLCLDLIKEFPNNRSDTAENTQQSVAKSFLTANVQLLDQMVEAVLKGHLGLALIGMKTMLESNVNANYIFDHPQHKKDFGWIDSLCKDVFERTNNLKAYKNQLGNKSVKERMIAIGAKDLHDQNYASLNDYCHLVLRLSIVNISSDKEDLSIDIISQALCSYMGVIDSICECFSLKGHEDLKKEVVSFSDKYERHVVGKSSQSSPETAGQ